MRSTKSANPTSQNSRAGLDDRSSLCNVMMKRSRVGIWIQASRPKTLWAAIAPVIMGTALAIADGKAHPLAAVACLLGAIAIQIGTNFANDYYDFARGTDTVERLGPTRVTQAGLVTPRSMKLAIAIAFGLAFMVGCYLVWRGGWPLVVIGLLSILCGILYTAGPYPLAYNGLGELFVLLFFGPVAVGGTFYVQALTVHSSVILAGLTPGLLSVAILIVNNLRDIDQDRVGLKRTLAVRFGRTFSRIEYLLSLVFAVLIPAVMAITGYLPKFTLLTLAILPLAMPVLRNVFTKSDGPSLNNCLAATGKLLLAFSILFSVGQLV